MTTTPVFIGGEWREISGKGAVFSYTIAERGTPAFRGAEPYVVVSVTLDVGVNFIANMIHCTAEQLKNDGVRLVSEEIKVGAGGHQYVFVHPSSTGGVLLELIQELAN